MPARVLDLQGIGRDGKSARLRGNGRFNLKEKAARECRPAPADTLKPRVIKGCCF